jgi:hypothetical protein
MFFACFLFKVLGFREGAQNFLDKIFREDKYLNFKKESFDNIIQRCPIVVVEEFDKKKKMLAETGEYKELTVC